MFRKKTGVCLMNRLRFLLVAIGFLAQTQIAHAYSTVNHISRIDSTISWIWANGRAPTGNASYFYGHQLGFYNVANTNGADRSFGYFLQYTYDMYCASKGLPFYCLGARLRVNFSISGPDVNSKVMMVNLNGVTTVSNYFQQIRSSLFRGLENMGGASPLSEADRLLIQPLPERYVATEFKIINNSLGQGNAIWKGVFSTNMLNTLNSRIGNVLKFEERYKNIVQSDTLFGYSQGQLTDAYKSKGSSDRVTAVISAPSARDSFGRAYVQVSSAPIFIMNHCANYGVYSSQFAAGSIQDQGCTGVGIFLHELGHQMGLGHCSSGQTSPCTDNLANTTSGRAYLVNHITNRTNALRVRYAY